MKEFQKGVLDNDRVISAENVQCMGEVIALCAIKTVIVRGGKDLHNLYKGLLRDINRASDDMSRYSDGYDIAQEAMLFLCQHMGKRLDDVYSTKTGRKITITEYYKSALTREPLQLINNLVKEIQLYDDKMLIIYNTPKTVNLDESQGFSFCDKNVKMPYVIQNKKYYGLKDFRLIMRL